MSYSLAFIYLHLVVIQAGAALPYYLPTFCVPPPSAIGSDQASKSSDATSDSWSLNDGSVVGEGASFPNIRHGKYIIIVTMQRCHDAYM